MTPETAKKNLAMRMSDSGIPLNSLTASQGVRLMLAFYRDVRADGCELDEDGDMLLFQWGTYDFGEGESFQFNITRQFIVAEEEDDAAISQLSLTFHFAPSARMKALSNGNRWCGTPSDLEEFEVFITESKAHQEIGSARPANVTLDYGGM